MVITGDILLADRCLKKGATVIGHNGKPFTSASIGGAIATRAIMADLRSGAGVTGGPAPFAKADRSRFLQALDEALVRLARGCTRPRPNRGIRTPEVASASLRHRRRRVGQSFRSPAGSNAQSMASQGS